MIKKILCTLLFLYFTNYCCDPSSVPSSGTRLWDVVAEDLAVDIATLSKVCMIDALIDNITSVNSLLTQAASVNDIIASKVMAIDIHTIECVSIIDSIANLDQTIVSRTANIYNLDQTINSQLDVINSIDNSTLSKIMVIDTRTSNIASNVTNIYNLDQTINSQIDIINNTDQTILSRIMVIDTRTSSIASNVTNIYNLDQTINSKLDIPIILEQSILSKVSALSTCCTNTTTDQVFTSLYATSEIGNRLDSINIKFDYGIPSLTTTTVTQTSGTVTASNSMAVLSATTASGSMAQIQSKGSVRFRSGHDTYAIFTVAFTGSFTGTSSQFIGPIDYQNGYAVGFNGTTFGVTMRNNTINTFVQQSQFNGDKLDGTGASGFNYSAATLNVFRIDYGDPGGSVIKFRIMNTNGQWITFHTIQYPNSSSTPSILQPFLPITARVENISGASSTLTLKTAGWNAGIVGSENYSSYRYFQTNRIVSTSTTVHILTIKNNTVFNSQPNHIQARIAGVIGGPFSATNFEMATLFLYKNATVSGTSFSDVSAGDSVMQVSTAGTYTASTGILMYSHEGRNSSTSPSMHYFTDSSPFILYPGETMTVIGQAFSGGSQQLIGGLSWEEQF